MKKFIFATAILFVASVVKTNAQSFMDRTHFEFSAGTGLKNKGITPIDFSFKANVDFVSISYLFVTAEDNVSLYNDDGVKTYYNGVSIGGGIGVRLLNSSKTIHAIDVRAKALGSVGNPAWKRSSYDISLAWYLKSHRFSPLSADMPAPVSLAWYLKSHRFSPVVELGYRFIDSRTKSIDNCGHAFLSIGLRY